MAESGKGEEKYFPFKVNGIELVSAQEKVLASRILDLAKEKGAMPGKSEDYILQGDKGPYERDATVDLLEDNIFITILNTPTQVAKHGRNVH